MEDFLLCFQCGNFYDDNERLPQIGSCSHSICSLCCSTLPDSSGCPICDKNNVFSEIELNLPILMNAKSIKEEMRKDSFKNMIEVKVKNLLERSCSECELSTRNLRICVDCVRGSGVLMKKVMERDWIVQYFYEKMFSVCSLLCADCALSNHESHKTVVLHRIGNLSDAIAVEYFLQSPNEDGEVVDIYNVALGKYQLWTEFYQKVVINIFNPIGDYEDVSQELKKDSEESMVEINMLAKEVLKLRQRELIFYQEYLKSHIRYHEILIKEEDIDEEVRKNIEINLKKLITVDQKFFEVIQHFSLTPMEIEEIDEKIDLKMEKLEECYRNGLLVEIKGFEDSKFYKYQALLEELQKTDNTLNPYEIDEDDDDKQTRILSEKKDKLREIQKTIQLLSSQKMDESGENQSEVQLDQLKIARSFFQMELIEDGFLFNSTKIKYFKHLKRSIYNKLMRLKFFPILPYDDFENAAFDRFITDIKKMMHPK